MKIFENVKVGYEIEFSNSKGKTQTAIVTYVDKKQFSVEILQYNEFKNSLYDLTLSWFLSGKKTSRFYNYGEATRIVHKWSQKAGCLIDL